MTNNIINNQAQNSEVPSIELIRISDGLTVSGNVINGGKDGLSSITLQVALQQLIILSQT